MSPNIGDSPEVGKSAAADFAMRGLGSTPIVVRFGGTSEIQRLVIARALSGVHIP